MRQLVNDGRHIADIMQTSTCAKHGAEHGEPCWTLRIMVDKRLAPALCGSRVKKFGFDGAVSSDSMTNHKPSWPQTPKSTRRSSLPNPQIK